MVLRESEFIERKIDHSYGVPMRLVDWVRVPLLFIMIGVGIFMISFYFYSGRKSMDLFPSFFGVYLIFMSIYYLYKLLYVRKKNLKSLVYLITNQRLIIYDEKSKVTLHSFEYQNFPPFTFHESPYNDGYIVIGEEEPLIVGKDQVFSRKGVNLEDHQIVLENLSQVKKEYDFLKAKVEQFHKVTE